MQPFDPATIIRFPSRRSAAVWLLPAHEGGWLVVARGHGSLHGDQTTAREDAQWLAQNLDLPIREYSP